MNRSSILLRDALTSTGLVQPIETTGKAGSVSCLCRQLPGKEASWLKVVDSMLTRAELNGIKLHVCRRYVKKNGSLAFGWFVGVESASAKGAETDVESLVTHLSQFSNNVEERAAPMKAPVRSASTKPSNGIRMTPAPGGGEEISEIPLPFVSRDLNVPNKKLKGATSYGGGGNDQN